MYECIYVLSCSCSPKVSCENQPECCKLQNKMAKPPELGMGHVALIYRVNLFPAVTNAHIAVCF